MNRSTPALPVHHQLPEFTQTHVHQVGDAIQPSHPLLSPFPPSPNPSQHQGLSQWVNSLHEVAKVLEFQLQHQSLQWTPRADLIQDGLVGSLCSPRDSQESYTTPQFKSINFSALSFLHSPTLTSINDHWKNHSLTRWTFVGKVMSLLFNMPRLVITFLPRSKRLLISWLQSPSSVILQVRGGNRECQPATVQGVVEMSYPTSKKRLLRGRRRAEMSYSTFKFRRGGPEKIALVQGKEQRLCFAGAAVKRCPTSKVRETQVRW